MGESLYSKNLKVWQRTCPEAAAIVDSWKESPLLHTHSEDLNAEADEWFNALKPGFEELIYVFGLGGGHYYLAAKKWLHDDPARSLVFLEPDPAVIRNILNTEIGEELVNDRQVSLYLYSEDSGGESQIIGIIKKFAQKSYLFSYRCAYEPAASSVKSRIDFSTTMIAGAQREGMEGGAGMILNFAQNYLGIPRSFPFAKMFGQFKGVPAIICGAGPSLDKNIELLGTLTDRALIFAGGTALNALNARGVLPHFGAGLDPNQAQYTRLVMNAAYELPFFYLPRMNHSAFEMIHGERLYVNGASTYGFSDWMDKTIGVPESEAIEVGFNVINFTVSLAQALGCNPIICVGVDLAYSRGESYASGIELHPIHERKEHFRTKKISEELVLYKDIYGDPIHTLWKWVAESMWYSKFAASHPDVVLINATEGGIGFAGVPNIPLSVVKEQFLDKEYNIDSLVHGVIHSQRMPDCVNTETVVNAIEGLIKSLEVCSEHYQTVISQLSTDHDEKVIEQELEAIKGEAGYRTILEFFERVRLEVDQHPLDQLKFDEAVATDEEVEKKRCSIALSRYQSLNESARITALALHLMMGRWMDEQIAARALTTSSGFIDTLRANYPVPSISHADLYSYGGDVLRICDPELNIDITDTSDAEGEVVCYADGRVRIEQHRCSGLLHGPSTYYHPNGTVLSRVWYCHGLKVGKVFTSYASGVLHSLKRYVGGVLDGRQEYFYENGLPKSSIGYTSGVLDGPIELFHPSGLKARQLVFNKGKRCGSELTWNEAGVLIIQVEYKDDHPVGVSRSWHSNGVLAGEVTYDPLGVKIGSKSWTSDGKLIVDPEQDSKDYFDRVAGQVDVLTKSLDNIVQEMTKTLPEVNREIQGNKNGGLDFDEEMKLLQGEMSKLQELSKGIMSGDGEKGREPIWKTPEMRREMHRGIDKMNEELTKEFKAINQGLSEIIAQMNKTTDKKDNLKPD